MLVWIYDEIEHWYFPLRLSKTTYLGRRWMSSSVLRQLLIGTKVNTAQRWDSKIRRKQRGGPRDPRALDYDTTAAATTSLYRVDYIEAPRSRSCFWPFPIILLPVVRHMLYEHRWSRSYVILLPVISTRTWRLLQVCMRLGANTGIWIRGLATTALTYMKSRNASSSPVPLTNSWSIYPPAVAGDVGSGLTIPRPGLVTLKFSLRIQLTMGLTRWPRYIGLGFFSTDMPVKQKSLDAGLGRRAV